MSTLNDVKEFLQAVFGSDWREKCFLCNSGDWRRRKLEDLDPKLDCYWCVGAIPWGKSRKVENVEDVRALVIDDVGTKVLGAHVRRTLAQATAITLTSKGNYQWAYSLPAPIAPEAWRGFFAGVEAALEQKLDGGDAVHLFRLPMGMNTKPGKRNRVEQDVLNHLTKLRSWNTPVPIEPLGPKTAAATGDGAEIKLGLDDLREFMGWIDTKAIDRKLWVNIVGHGLKALCKNDEDGFTVFDEWSDPEKAPGYNRKTWDSLGKGGLYSRAGKLKALAQAANQEGFARMFAKKVFPPDPSEPPEGGGYKVTPERMAEEIAAAETGQLGWLDVAPGRWAAFDPVIGRWVRYAGDAVLWAVVKQEMQRRAGQSVDAKISAAMDSGKWRPTVCRLLNKEVKLMLASKNFDANTDLVGMPGRVLVLNYGKGLPYVQRPGVPGDWVSKSTSTGPAPYDSNKRNSCPHWTKFMGEFAGKPEVVRWWQTFLGYCLSGRTEEHSIVFLYGPGGNGKSVLLDVIGEVLGDYHVRADHRLFMAKGTGNFHLAPLAALEGARLVTVPDVPNGATWDMGIVKQVTGGGTVTANKMHQDPTSYTPQFKIILAGNEKPRLDNVDDGIRRRMVLVPAMYKPLIVDKGLVDKLRLEKAGILSWLIEGWGNYAIAGLPFCSVIDSATKEYIDGSDVFGKWWASVDQNAAEKRLKMADAFRSWDAFRSAEGAFRTAPNSARALSTKLEEMGVIVKRNNQGAYVDRAALQVTDIADIF